MRRLLERLAGHPRARIYVISGRPLAYLEKWVRIPGVNLMGLHGWERPGVKPPAPEYRRWLEIKRSIHERFSAVPGVWVEDKGVVFAVHYRKATASETRMGRRLMLEILKTFEPAIHLIKGRMIWEFLPSFVDGKGAAAVRLMTGAPRQWVPIYAGDDESDEPAFAMVKHGVTVHVGGSRHTAANFRLRDAEEVKDFLSRLQGIMPGQPRAF
jgi:trehalose 6-phosphate phosphatase